MAVLIREHTSQFKCTSTISDISIKLIHCTFNTQSVAFWLKLFSHNFSLPRSPVLSMDHCLTDPNMPLHDALFHGVWSSALLAVKFMMRVGICVLPQKCLAKHTWNMAAFGSWAGCQCQTYSLIPQCVPVCPRSKVLEVFPLSAPGSPRSSDRNAKFGHGTPKATQCTNRKS
jgi:hypothetical protein